MKEIRANGARALWRAAIAAVAIGSGSLFGATSSGPEIVVGQTASFTNPVVSALSREYSAGIDLALARTNLAGGIKGRKLRLAVSDDNFDALRTVAAVNELVAEQNVVALVGVMGTQPTMRLAEEKTLERHQLASIGPMTGLRSALGQAHVFPVRGNYEDEVLAMLVHSARLGAREVGFLFYQAGVGPQLAKLLPEMAKRTQAAIVGMAGFMVTKGREEQRAEVLKALDTMTAKPQAMILIAVGSAHSEALKALRDRYGRSMPVYSLGQVNVDAVVKEVGQERAWGLMLTQVMPMPGGWMLPITREFESDRKRLAPEWAPTYMLLEGYVAGRVAVEILRRAKAPTRGEVLRAAHEAGQINVGGFVVEYGSEIRRSVNPIDLTMIGRTGALVR